MSVSQQDMVKIRSWMGANASDQSITEFAKATQGLGSLMGIFKSAEERKNRSANRYFLRTMFGESLISTKSAARDMYAHIAATGALPVGFTRALSPKKADDILDILSAQTSGFMDLPEELEGMSAGQRARNYVAMLTLADQYPQAAAAMNTANLLPIAKIMIEEAVMARLADVQQIQPGQPALEYRLKNRVRAVTSSPESGRPRVMHIYSSKLIHPKDYTESRQLQVRTIQDSQFDPISSDLTDMGKELLVKVDGDWFETLFRGSSKDRAIDAVNHQYPFGTAIPPGATFVEQNSVYLPNAIIPTMTEILLARMELESRSYTATDIIAHPVDLGRVMAQTAVLQAFAYGNDDVQQKGMVGKLAGLTVNSSRVMKPGRMYIVARPDALHWIQKEPINVISGFSGGGQLIDLDATLRGRAFLRNINAIEALQFYV